MKETIKRGALAVVFSLQVALICSCALPARVTKTSREAELNASATASGPTRAPGFDLVNFTGTNFRSIYVSPSTSSGWEENVLGADELNDGDTLDLRFNAQETNAMWDIRIESKGHFAEWKNLDLRGVSRITLFLNLVNEPAVVAELE